MSDKTRQAIADRLAANRKSTGVAIRAPKPAPKATPKPKPAPEPVPEPVEATETVEEDTSGAEG